VRSAGSFLTCRLSQKGSSVAIVLASFAKMKGRTKCMIGLVVLLCLVGTLAEAKKADTKVTHKVRCLLVQAVVCGTAYKQASSVS